MGRQFCPRGSSLRRLFNRHRHSLRGALGSLALLVGAVLGVAGVAVASRAAVDPFAASTCFAAGTPVLTEQGPRPIETITVGTRVWARDELGETAGWQPVVRTFERRADSLVHLTLEDARGTESTLAVTPNHPIFVLDRGWTAAGALIPGRDQLVDDDGHPIAVRAATRLLADQAVYNLEVANHPTYFAGAAKIWAHNRCGEPAVGNRDATGARDHVPWRHD
ncbi:MAG TPA: Hint domain-containing protein [Polyangia bacterium]